MVPLENNIRPRLRVKYVQGKTYAEGSLIDFRKSESATLVGILDMGKVVVEVVEGSVAAGSLEGALLSHGGVTLSKRYDVSRSQASDKKSQARLDGGRELLGRTRKLALAGTKTRTIYLVYSWETWVRPGSAVAWVVSRTRNSTGERSVLIQYELHGMEKNNTTLSPPCELVKL